MTVGYGLEINIQMDTVNYLKRPTAQVTPISGRVITLINHRFLFQKGIVLNTRAILKCV
jgi:hypothetical protein